MIESQCMSVICGLVSEEGINEVESFDANDVCWKNKNCEKA
jgi:hypothetical protein